MAVAAAAAAPVVHAAAAAVAPAARAAAAAATQGATAAANMIGGALKVHATRARARASVCVFVCAGVVMRGRRA